VQLRGEAFEYLQLPLVIKEGSVGRLKLQVGGALGRATVKRKAGLRMHKLGVPHPRPSPAC
jgi:hypothetical protein